MPSDSAQRHRARAALWAGDDQRRQVHGPRGHCCRLDEEQAIPRMRPYELRTVDRRRAAIRGGSSDRLRRSASVASGLRLRQARLRSPAVPRPRAAVSTRRAPVTRRIRPSMYPCSYVTQKVRCPGMEAVLRALADESRRTMLETLSGGPATAGELAALLPIARPGVSRHLRVLRESGLVDVRQEAQRRVYTLRPEPLAEVDEWLGRYRVLWEQRLNALHTEVARGKRERRSTR